MLTGCAFLGTAAGVGSLSVLLSLIGALLAGVRAGLIHLLGSVTLVTRALFRRFLSHIASLIGIRLVSTFARRGIRILRHNNSSNGASIGSGLRRGTSPA